MPVVDPLFWLGLSLLLVATSLMSVLLVAVPAFRELARAARSAEKLFDTLNRELPPTLEAIRLTGLELTDLTDDVSEGVQQAGRVIQQVDQGVSVARDQAKQLQVGGQSFLAGAKAAWKAWSRPTRSTSPPLRPSSRPASRNQEPRLRKPKRTHQFLTTQIEKGSQPSVTQQRDEPSETVSPLHARPQPAKTPPEQQPIQQQQIKTSSSPGTPESSLEHPLAPNSDKQTADKQTASASLPPSTLDYASPGDASQEPSFSSHSAQETQND